MNEQFEKGNRVAIIALKNDMPRVVSGIVQGACGQIC